MNFLRRLAVLLSRWMDDVSLAVMSINGVGPVATCVGIGRRVRPA